MITKIGEIRITNKRIFITGFKFEPPYEHDPIYEVYNWAINRLKENEPVQRKEYNKNLKSDQIK